MLKKIFKENYGLFIDIFLGIIALTLGILFFSNTTTQINNSITYHFSNEDNFQLQFYNFLRENGLDKRLNSKQIDFLYQQLVNEYKNNNNFDFDTAISALIPDSKTLSSDNVTKNQADQAVQKKYCKLPRGGEIKDGEFVLAYQQRSDVPEICNVERRYCVNGVLLGNYTQESCKTNIKYEYETEPIVVYNLSKRDPRIQPYPPVNKNAEFDVNGHLYKKKRAKLEILPEKDKYYVLGSEKLNNNEIYCKTPWGEKIKAGQFVKAYKKWYGTENKPCEVELRYCLNGKLLGSFRYKNCYVLDF